MNNVLKEQLVNEVEKCDRTLNKILHHLRSHGIAMDLSDSYDDYMDPEYLKIRNSDLDDYQKVCEWRRWCLTSLKQLETLDE